MTRSPDHLGRQNPIIAAAIFGKVIANDFFRGALCFLALGGIAL
jgi:hypothetical protein